MSDNDDTIEARLVEASEQLVASFSDLDTEAELRAVRSGLVPVGVAKEYARSPRWLAVAAVVTLLAGGTLALAVSRAMRSDNDSASPIVLTPETTPVVSVAPAVTESAATTAPTATDPSARTTAPATTEVAAPAAPATTVPPTAAPESSGPLVESPGDVFVMVSGDREAVIDVRDAVGVVASFDLTCPPNRDCVVQSARVMGDTIWVAITDTEPGAPDSVVESRVVSVSRSTGDVVEHLSLDGPAAVRSAGRGADGVLYAHVDGQALSERSLVAVERGEARVVETGVSGFRLSDDGRFLAVSFSNPPAGELARFEITNLVDHTTASFHTDSINAGPAAWSPDGRHLIVNEQWEGQTAWVVDPWSGSGDSIPGTERFLDGACFMSDHVVAHRTWNVGYGQGDAQLGVIRLTSLNTGSTVAEIGDNLFGDSFRCHPDGSISYLRRPVVEVQLSPDFTQLEPDYEAPVDLVHIAPDGTTSIGASGALRMP
jgi:hypothetical protein